jgi:hypothetical protein
MTTLDAAGVSLYVVGYGRVSLHTTPTLTMLRAIAEYEEEHAEDDIIF